MNWHTRKGRADGKRNTSSLVNHRMPEIHRIELIFRYLKLLTIKSNERSFSIKGFAQ